MVRIDAVNGALPSPLSKRTILEAFKRGNEPTDSSTAYSDDDGIMEYMDDLPLSHEDGLY